METYFLLYIYTKNTFQQVTFARIPMYINHKSPKGTNWELMSNFKKNEDTLTDSDYNSF